MKLTPISSASKIKLGIKTILTLNRVFPFLRVKFRYFQAQTVVHSMTEGIAKIREAKFIFKSVLRHTHS